MSISSSERCQVCSKQSHGLHFGAITCRACAAYFRRAILKKYEQLDCINGDQKCENSCALCRKCRLDKCIEAGMTEKRLQLGRDPMSSTVKQPSPSSSFVIGRPLFITSSFSENRSCVNFSKLIEKASTILSNIYKSDSNTLDRLTSATTSADRKVFNKIGKLEILSLWECNFLRATQWFTNFDEFEELPLELKIKFVKSVWMAWSCLYTDVMTANHQLNQVEKNVREVVLSDECVVNQDLVEIDLSWFAKENFVGTGFTTQKVIDELKNFRPTPQETIYMLTVLSFRHACKMFRDDFETLADKVIQKLADQIHSYYIDKVQITQYAQRIAQIMKIVNIVERKMFEIMEKLELARMFDVIRVDFSHPEIIYGK